MSKLYVNEKPSLTKEQFNEILQAVRDYFYLSPSSPIIWDDFMALCSAKENGTLTDEQKFELEYLKEEQFCIYRDFVHDEFWKATGVANNLIEKGRSAKDATAEVVKSYKAKSFDFNS